MTPLEAEIRRTVAAAMMTGMYWTTNTALNGDCHRFNVDGGILVIIYGPNRNMWYLFYETGEFTARGTGPDMETAICDLIVKIEENRGKERTCAVSTRQ